MIHSHSKTPLYYFIYSHPVIIITNVPYTIHFAINYIPYHISLDACTQLQ